MQLSPAPHGIAISVIREFDHSRITALGSCSVGSKLATLNSVCLPNDADSRQLSNGDRSVHCVLPANQSRRCLVAVGKSLDGLLNVALYFLVTPLPDLCFPTDDAIVTFDAACIEFECRPVNIDNNLLDESQSSAT